MRTEIGYSKSVYKQMRRREEMSRPKVKNTSEYAYQLYNDSAKKFVTGLDINGWSYSRVRYKVKMSDSPARATMASLETVSRIFEKRFQLEELRNKFKSQMKEFVNLSDNDFEMETGNSRMRIAEDLESIDKTLAFMKKTKLKRVKMAQVEDDEHFSKEKKARISRIVKNTFITQVEYMFEDAIQIAHHYLAKPKSLDKQGGAYVFIQDEEYDDYIDRKLLENEVSSAGIEFEKITKPYTFCGMIYIKDVQDAQLLRLSLSNRFVVKQVVTIEDLKKKYSNIKKHVTQQMSIQWDL